MERANADAMVRGFTGEHGDARSRGSDPRADRGPRRRLRRAPVLTDVSFALHAGERMGVLGPNGGGRRRSSACCSASSRPSPGRCGRARFAVVPQTERSRWTSPSARSTSPSWARSPRCRGGAARVRAAPRRARRARGGGPGRAGERDLRRPLRRPAPARPRRPRAVQDARVILLTSPSPASTRRAPRPRGAARRARRRGARRDDRHPRRRPGARVGRVLCLNGRQVAFGAPDATLHRDVLEDLRGRDRRAAGGELRAVVPPHHDH